MKKEKAVNFPLTLTENRENHLASFRQNIDYLMDLHDMTMKELAEKAEIPFSTLNTFLYDKEAKDCRLSTAIKLSKVFGISVDELVGAGTIEPETKECIAMSRSLKPHHRYVIRAYVKHQYKLHGNVPQSSKQISIMLPECERGYLRTTNVTEAINIDHLQPGTRSRVCLGLRIPCEHYEPYYMQNEILLLGADRDGLNNERCVVSHNGNFYLCVKRIEILEDKSKKVSYLSLMDGHNKLFDYEEIDDKIGYVIGFLNPDGTWGTR